MANRDARPAQSPPRIVGGRFRGRKLQYNSRDSHVRPMKERVREALFNLVGPAVEGKHAIDLFAGTGALGLEAISRGAVGATFVERHFPTADLVRKNIESLGVEDFADVIAGDTFVWVKREPALPEVPWLVLCSPPYELYVSRHDDLLDLLGRMLERAEPSSIFAVEADRRFDFGQLPRPAEWDVREYLPAVVGVLRVSENQD